MSCPVLFDSNAIIAPNTARLETLWWPVDNDCVARNNIDRAVASIRDDTMPAIFTYHFNGSGRAVGPLCVCVCPDNNLNEMTFDLDIRRADSS